MFESCLEKQKQLVSFFSEYSEKEAKYQKIMEWGKTLPLIKTEYKVEQNLVRGCQSVMFLHTDYNNNTLSFTAFSDALISSGLAALIISVYNHETPETLLKCPPTFIEELGLKNLLSLNRSNGLYHIHLKMKQDALQFLL